MKKSDIARGRAGGPAADAVPARRSRSPARRTRTRLTTARLNNTVYTYADLKQAKARDLSDTQIAKIAKIARLSGTPFGDIVNAIVIQGKTFVTLADRVRHPAVRPGPRAEGKGRDRQLPVGL